MPTLPVVASLQDPDVMRFLETLKANPHRAGELTQSVGRVLLSAAPADTACRPQVSRTPVLQAKLKVLFDAGLIELARDMPTRR